jgi:hypothetical protein
MSTHYFPMHIVIPHGLNPRAVAPTPSSARRPEATITSTTDDRASFLAGIRQERRRWAKVLSSAAFGAEPVTAAHLLANSSMPAAEIIAVLRDVAADAKAAPAVRQAAIADGWASAMRRAGGG